MLDASSGVDLSIVLAYTVGLVLVYLLFRLLWLPAKAVFRVTAAIAIGALSIGVLNLLGQYVGIAVPFNVISVLSAGLLGLPGIVLVIAVGALL